MAVTLPVYTARLIAGTCPAQASFDDGSLGIKTLRRVGLSIGFSTALWLAALALCAWLWLAPLAWNYWAVRSWKPVPCHASSTIGMFTYRVGDAYYFSNRRDFWQVKYDEGRATPFSDAALNGDTCWVNPNDPQDAVRFLDAPTHLSNGAGRFAAGTALLVGVFIVTRRRRQATPTTSNAGPPQGGDPA